MAFSKATWSSTKGGGGSSLSMDSILQRLQEQQNAANRANQRRLNEAMSIYDQIIAQFSEGGTFGAGVEAQIEKARKKAVGQGTQALVSSGLYGTEAQAGLGTTFEEEVGIPARLQLEDIRAEKLAEARRGKAAAIERVEDVGPSMDVIASLMKSVGAGGTTTTLHPTAAAGLDIFGQPLGQYFTNVPSTTYPSVKKTTSQRVVDVPGHYSTGTGADSGVSKGTYIPTRYKMA